MSEVLKKGRENGQLSQSNASSYLWPAPVPPRTIARLSVGTVLVGAPRIGRFVGPIALVVPIPELEGLTAPRQLAL